jgi:hypothetical protein
MQVTCRCCPDSRFMPIAILRVSVSLNLREGTHFCSNRRVLHPRSGPTLSPAGNCHPFHERPLRSERREAYRCRPACGRSICLPRYCPRQRTVYCRFHSMERSSPGAREQRGYMDAAAEITGQPVTLLLQSTNCRHTTSFWRRRKTERSGAVKTWSVCGKMGRQSAWR